MLFCCEQSNLDIEDTKVPPPILSTYIKVSKKIYLRKETDVEPDGLGIPGPCIQNITHE